MSIATKTGDGGMTALMFNRRISKTDILRGFKENVIMGHLIPAGTGLGTHKELKIVSFAPEAGDAPTIADATA